MRTRNLLMIQVSQSKPRYVLVDFKMDPSWLKDVSRMIPRHFTDEFKDEAR